MRHEYLIVLDFSLMHLRFPDNQAMFQYYRNFFSLKAYKFTHSFNFSFQACSTCQKFLQNAVKNKLPEIYILFFISVG